jgi:hypothetical protein
MAQRGGAGVTMYAPTEEETRWSAVLDRIAGEIAHRDELLAAGRVSELRAPAMDVPEELGPVPTTLVPRVHELVERLASQQAAVERELMAIQHELARTATMRPGPLPRSVDEAPSNGFEARA